jgi:uncharacterized protein DUF1697
MTWRRKAAATKARMAQLARGGIKPRLPARRETPRHRSDAVATETDMAVIISLLRAVNVGGHNKIKMEALRAPEQVATRNSF